MGESPVRCAECGAEFGSAQQLDDHNQAMHAGGGGQQSSAATRTSGSFTCAACGATFASRDQLQAHQQQAHGNWA